MDTVTQWKRNMRFKHGVLGLWLERSLPNLPAPRRYLGRDACLPRCYYHLSRFRWTHLKETHGRGNLLSSTKGEKYMSQTRAGLTFGRGRRRRPLGCTIHLSSLTFCEGQSEHGLYCRWWWWWCPPGCLLPPSLPPVAFLGPFSNLSLRSITPSLTDGHFSSSTSRWVWIQDECLILSEGGWDKNRMQSLFKWKILKKLTMLQIELKGQRREWIYASICFAC